MKTFKCINGFEDFRKWKVWRISARSTHCGGESYLIQLPDISTRLTTLFVTLPPRFCSKYFFKYFFRIFFQSVTLDQISHKYLTKNTEISDTASRYLHLSHHTLRHTATTVLQDIFSNIFPDIFLKCNSGSNISQISYKNIEISDTTSRYLHPSHHTLPHIATAILQQIFFRYFTEHISGLKILQHILPESFKHIFWYRYLASSPHTLGQTDTRFCKIFCWYFPQHVFGLDLPPDILPELFWSIPSDTIFVYLSPSPHTLRNVAMTMLHKIFPDIFQNITWAQILRISYHYTDQYLIQIQIPDTTSSRLTPSCPHTNTVIL